MRNIVRKLVNRVYKREGDKTMGSPWVDNDKFYLTDSGLETVLIFQKDRELREFASFELLASSDPKKEFNERDYELLEEYFLEHATVAFKHNMGLIFETPTWRASSDWGAKLGYSKEELHALNCKGVATFKQLKHDWIALRKQSHSDILISGCVGPKGDGYVVGDMLTADQYYSYHLPQLKSLWSAGADLLSALTINNIPEALGIAKAAMEVKATVVISFTVETDAKLPSGEALSDAIEQVDKATNNFVKYYMINCAHPTHVSRLFSAKGRINPTLKRVKGIRANASKLSHAELDSAEELDDGNPEEFGEELKALHTHHPQFTVLGGCCGTDIRHIKCVASQFSNHKDVS